MKINVYASEMGTVWQYLENSELDKTAKRLSDQFLYSYDSEDHKIKQVGVEKPIINPHMKPKRPSYREAWNILHRFENSNTTYEATLERLGFEPEGGDDQ